MRNASANLVHHCSAVFVALAMAVVAAPAGAQTALDLTLGQSTPLVLKDGRIANVSVHTVPFPTGEGALDEGAIDSLRAILEPLATDCFLTAQAIGHVDPGLTRDGDTLNAHRLARARADHVQSELASFGMPEPSVASVWDWQFLVKESRVTLWVFSLNIGDDCTGASLPAATLSAEAPSPTTEQQVAASDMAMPPSVASDPVIVAEVPATATAVDPAQNAARASSTEIGEPLPVTGATQSVAESAAPSELTDDATEVVAEPASTPKLGDTTSAASADVANGSDQLATAAVDSVTFSEEPTGTPARLSLQQESATPAESTSTDGIAAVGSAMADDAGAEAIPEPSVLFGSPGTVAAVAPSESADLEAGDADADFVLAFAMNSSFFPSGATQELRRFLEELPANATVELELTGAVGTGNVRGAEGEEAERYHEWMADRRVKRVIEWLEANAGDRRLTFSEQLVPDDQSREVRIDARVVQ